MCYDRNVNTLRTVFPLGICVVHTHHTTQTQQKLTMKPHRCCNPLCHASFTNMPHLLRNARMSGRCAAYWDLRKTTNVIQTVAIEPSLTTTSKKRKSNPTQQISVLPPVGHHCKQPKNKYISPNDKCYFV